MLEHDRSYAEPIHASCNHQRLRERHSIWCNLPKIEKLMLSEIFNKTKVHEAGKLVTLALTPVKRKATYRLSFHEIDPDQESAPDELLAKDRGATSMHMSFHPWLVREIGYHV